VLSRGTSAYASGHRPSALQLRVAGGFSISQVENLEAQARRGLRRLTLEAYESGFRRSSQDN
jgi:hypothetical protein